MLPEPPARMSKFYYYFGKIIFDVPQKNDTFLGENSLLPSQCPTKQLQYGRSGPVGGSIPPWSSVARYVFQLCLSMYLLNLARARGVRHNFGTLTRAQFSQKSATILGLSPRADFSQKSATILGLFTNTNFGNFRFAFPLF